MSALCVLISRFALNIDLYRSDNWRTINYKKHRYIVYINLMKALFRNL